MKSVVWVCSEISATPRSGGELRTHRLLAAVAARYPVHVVAVADDVDEHRVRESTGAAQVSAFPWPASPVQKRLTALRHGWPLYFSWAHNPQARDAVGALARAGGVVVIDHLNMATHRPGGERYILSLHNDEAKLFSESQREHSLRRELERRWDLVTLWRQQAQLTRDPRARVVVVSEADARSLRVPCTVVPNGTDLPLAVPPVPERGTILFVGSMTYEPNAEAVRWWTGEVWPLLEAGTPPLTVVGRGGHEKLRDVSGHAGLTVVGEVEDVSAHLASATVVAIPLQSGGGTRIKLLEALAWGRPVVTTSKGAEGIPVVHGTNVLLADSANEFAAALRALLEDRDLRQALSEAGRDLAEHFSWTKCGEGFVSVIEDVMNEERPC